MAALRLNTVKILTNYLRIGGNSIQLRSKSSSVLTTATGQLNNVEKVVTSSDGTTSVSWHPTKDFPYEYSLPIPEGRPETASLLKEDAIQTAMRAFGNKHPEIARQELMKVTHTSKHVWKPRQRDKKAKKTPMDRTYL